MKRWHSIAFLSAAAIAALLIVDAPARAADFLAHVMNGARFVPQTSRPNNCTTGRYCDWTDSNGASRRWNGAIDLYGVAVSPSPSPKGQIPAYSGSASTGYYLVTAGSDGTCLKADSTEAAGLEWGACSSNSLQESYTNGAAGATQTVAMTDTNGGVSFDGTAMTGNPTVFSVVAADGVSAFAFDNTGLVVGAPALFGSTTTITTIKNGNAGNETATVGAAGAAAALPAQPLGYLTIQLNAGTSVKVPYYNP